MNVADTSGWLEREIRSIGFRHKRPSDMDEEMEKFQQDLLKSVQQMKAGKAARTTRVALSSGRGLQSAQASSPERNHVKRQTRR
jgi:hypothetical protein